MITWPTPKALWESTQNARRATQEVQSVHLSVLGISSFWCMGSIVLANLPVLAQQQLCLNETALSWLLALFAIGVAMGSLLANTFSHKRLELGLVPLASLGIGVGLVGLYTSLPSNAACSGELLSFGHSASSLWVGLWLWVCGSFGGLFVVPLYTWVQLRTPSHNMGLVISHNNIQNAVFMVMGALLCLGLFALGSRVEHTLLLALAINTLCCVIIFKIIPEFLFRFAVMVLVRCIYRLRTQGASCIPMQGRAVLVANHVSWIDALVIAATCPRPPVFVMYYKIFQWPILGWFFRSVARAIPIAGKNEDAAMYHAAFARIQIALENDELLCIFPEGAISENGQLAAFKPGLFKALATTPAPLYAVGLSGLWNTIFSKQKQSWQQKLQGLLLSKTLHAHYAAVPSTNNTPESLQQWMRALCTPETI